MSSVDVDATSKLPAEFVYLSDICPSIVQALRYVGCENLVGRPLQGYRANRVICTAVCAERLARVQRQCLEHGQSLVVYDAYRPRSAVLDLYSWSQDPAANEMSERYYPEFGGDKKIQLFELGYISKTSNHCRGSTVDVTLCDVDKAASIVWDRPLPLTHRHLADGGQLLPFLDDGTWDMGTSFDLMHEASHEPSSMLPVTSPYAERRRWLRSLMEREGFVGLSEEWWHFWLPDEPFPRKEEDPLQGTFDFPVE